MRFGLAILLMLVVSTHGVLLAQGNGHVISGYVREEASNGALAAVTLQLLGAGGQIRPAVTSGMDGQFSFMGLPDGEYTVVASKYGYETATVAVSVMRTGTPPLTISLRRSASVKLTDLGRPVSAHELSVPERARTAYDRGLKLLEEEKKPAESLPEFQQAVKSFPSYYEAFTKIGVANYDLGKFAEAEQALKKAIDVSLGKFLDPLYLLADLYNGQRRYSEAESLARQAVALGDSSWNSHFELARALVGLKRGPEAEASALRARELKPDNPPVHLVLANAHLLEHNYQAAIQDFDTYLNLEPNGPLSEAVRQNREKLQRQFQQAPDAKQASPPPAALEKP